MRHFKSSLEFLDRVLAGDSLGVDEIESISLLDENLHLEFKGRELVDGGNEGKGPIVVRRCISAFANGEGGVLIVGIANQREEGGRRLIQGIDLIGSARLSEWAARSLTPIASFLSPPPRILEVATRSGAGHVLVIAIARQPRLVPVFESGRAVHYFRMHDQTLRSPEYLIADLVLGRRQHPALNLRRVDLVFGDRPPVPELQSDTVSATITIRIENQGFAATNPIVVGIVTWTYRKEIGEVTEYLLTFLRIRTPADLGFGGQVLSHYRMDSRPKQESDIPAFGSREFRTSVQWRMPTKGAEHHAALYVLPEGSPPEWYQLRVCVRQAHLFYSPTNLWRDHPNDIELKRATSHPLVAFDPITK